ncbi:MAG: zinc ribbon domain-containing protein [Chloroflexi bacterium]|nr:zinc ribbon domain-containing protein [Chloroflexota bacterium]
MLNPPEKLIVFDDDATRCPRCGKRLSADVGVCPACGYALIARHVRIRCARCKKRIPADARVCPRCGQDPHPKPIPRVVRLGALVIGGLMLLVCIGWVAYRAMTTDVLSRALGQPEPTRAPTIVQMLYVVATPVTPTPTIVFPPTLAPTPRVSPSATPRGARNTPLPVPTVSLPGYGAPQLIAPLNALIYPNGDAQVVLEWQSVSPSGLRENEWYAITVAYTARDGKPATQTRWTKETRWTVPSAYWSDAAPDARTFRWQVSVVRVEGIDPITSTSRVQVSPPSATRTFIWN